VTGVLAAVVIVLLVCLAQVLQWHHFQAVWQLVDVDLPRRAAAAEIAAQLVGCREAGMEFQRGCADAARRAAAMAAWDTADKRLRKLWAACSELDAGQEAAAGFGASKSTLEDCRKDLLAVGERYAAGPPLAADAVRRQLLGVHQRLGQAVEAAEAFAAEQESHVQAGRRRILRETASRVRLINAAGLVGLLAVALGVLWFDRRLLARLRGTAAAVAGLAVGELEVRLPSGGDDELAWIDRDIEGLAGCLRNHHRQLREAPLPAATAGSTDGRPPGEPAEESPPTKTPGETASPPPPWPAAPAGGIVPAAATPFRILVAEDGPQNRRLVCRILQQIGAEVVVAENGKEAVDMCLAATPRPFDLVLMDMQMPVVDGYQATRQLRQAGFAGSIVAVSAHAVDDRRQECLDAGCNDCLCKPLRRETLIPLVSKCTAGRR
jgi:CheY-like chemotaxis protein